MEDKEEEEERRTMTMRTKRRKRRKRRRKRRRAPAKPVNWAMHLVIRLGREITRNKEKHGKTGKTKENQ